MSPLAITATALLLLGLAVSLVALRRLRAHDRLHDLVLGQLPGIAVILFDHDLRFKRVLGAAVTSTGSAPEEVVGMLVTEVYPGEPGEHLAAEFRAALDGRTHSTEFLSPISHRHFSIELAPVRELDEIVGGIAVCQDITDRVRAECELQTEAGRRRLILEAMNEAYVACDVDGLITSWNRAAEQTFGWSASEAIGQPLPELIIPERDRADLHAVLQRRFPGQPPVGRFDIRADRSALVRDGSEITVELAATLIEIDGVTTLQSLMHDISDRKQVERDLREHVADFEALTDAVGELARSTEAGGARLAICRGAVRVADAGVAILFEPEPGARGLRASAAEGFQISDELLAFDEPSATVTAFETGEISFRSEVEDVPGINQSFVRRLRAKSALWVPVVQGGRTLGVIAIAWQRPVAAISERLLRVMGVIAAEAAVAIDRAELLDRLERMARTDDLTGLPNRRAWDLELQRELSRSKRDRTPLAVAMLDLDRFKDFNDRHGHQAGDRLLKEAGGVWREVLRDTDLLARYGGEEFVVALPRCAPDVAEQLVERLRSETPQGESCSAGLASWDGRETADQLIGRADAALYQAKQAGRDRTVSA